MIPYYDTWLQNSADYEHFSGFDAEPQEEPDIDEDEVEEDEDE